MDMAEVIRRRRAELGLSKADLAKAAGVDTRQIRRYEAGQQQPVLSVAVAIAKRLASRQRARWGTKPPGQPHRGLVDLLADLQGRHRGHQDPAGPSDWASDRG
jgi:transcriptional regulator with XRE-family HTH domain